MIESLSVWCDVALPVDDDAGLAVRGVCDGIGYPTCGMLLPVMRGAGVEGKFG